MRWQRRPWASAAEPERCRCRGSPDRPPAWSRGRSRCPATEVQAIDALEHAPGDEEILPADCVNNERIVVKCTVCGEVLVDEDAPKGELATGHESFDPASLDTLQVPNFHTQQVVRVRDGRREGIGVLEQVVLGPYAPAGLTGMTDGAV